MIPGDLNVSLLYAGLMYTYTYIEAESAAECMAGNKM